MVTQFTGWIWMSNLRMKRRSRKDMNLMQKLERKWGRYAIPRIHRYLIFAYFIGYVTQMFVPELMNYMAFSMELILQGQVWRLFTWIFCCNSSSILTVLFVFCLFTLGETLERFMGTFRMNVYLIGGMLLNLVVGILLYVIPLLTIGVGLPAYLSNYYTLLSMYMAMAILMPDAVVNLYFVIPIKMKWMLVVYLVSMAYELYVYYSMGGILFVLILGSQIICTLVNLFCFFHFSKIRPSRKHKKRQREFQQQFSQPRPSANITRHKCVICGRTEKDDPNLTFRYCSKCTGNKEYCQDHLFTHTHQ